MDDRAALTAGLLPSWATAGLAVLVAMTTVMAIAGVGNRPRRHGEGDGVELAARFRTLPPVLRSHELIVRFRPVRRLADGRIAAVEALPVWMHPGIGPIDGGPLRLLIEEADLGLEFDLEVVARCLPQLPSVLSLAEVDEPWLAVPVRVTSLRHPSFVGAVGEALATWQSLGDGLALVLDGLPRDDAARSAAQRLQDLGVWIVLPGPASDDATWRPAIDPDLVTVDCREVVAHGGDDTSLAGLRRARGSGAPVLATGLDTPAQERAARHHGAAFGMGDVVGAPSSLAELFGSVDIGPDDA